MTRLEADVRLPAIFSDHAVLQRSANVPVWGWADPGEEVSLSLGEARTSVRADSGGKWRAALDLGATGPGPHEMRVEGKNSLTVRNVLVGEVWLCSGQSNMEWPLRNTTGAEEEISTSTNPMLRQFLVKKNASPAPSDECEGAWTVASPETSGNFTAAGYYFGKRLQAELGRPVGLVHASWGGTPSEAWTSPEAMTGTALQATRDKQAEAVVAYPEQWASYPTRLREWCAAHGREDRPAGEASDFLTGPGGWKPVTLPGTLREAGLPDTGAVWVRRTIELPAAAEGKQLWVELGEIADFDEFYWNGEKLGETTPGREGPSRREYIVPASKTKAGPVEIALRIVCLSQGMGLRAETFKAGSIPLKGEWMAKAEYEFPPLAADALAAYPPRPGKPVNIQNFAGLPFNGMIHPLIPYAIKGVLWYQGESNVGRAWQYRESFPLLIRDWRKQWSQGDFPFYFCQLANFQPKARQPGESAWSELREAQALALAEPQTGMAVLIDSGETEDVHPRNKQVAGHRLASIALARDYGRNIPWSGPVFDSVTFDGSKAIVTFQKTDGGLVAKPLPETELVKSVSRETIPLTPTRPGSAVQGFSICGEDRQWQWADARIEENTVIVSSPEVPSPTAVRYGWADNPTCNLSNGAGLPASPFRTDNFPVSTRLEKF